jgi:hypothetical protein
MRTLLVFERAEDVKDVYDADARREVRALPQVAPDAGVHERGAHEAVFAVPRHRNLVEGAARERKGDNVATSVNKGRDGVQKLGRQW